MSLNIIQHKANMTNIMAKYTQDIILHIGKDITSIIKHYMNNYKPTSSNKLSIKLPIDENIIKIINNINEPSLLQSSKYFNFQTFKYNSNTKVNLLRTNLENYIQHFMPHWNECITEHYVTIGKQNLYFLTICFSIGITMKDETPDVITMRHNDHMNKVYCDYIINELNSVVNYIIAETNNTIKNDIISNEHLINVIGYLGEHRGYVDIFNSNLKSYDYMYLKQKNMINVLKLYNIPTEFKTIDYIRCIDKYIKYIYFKIEEYYTTQNIKIERCPISADIYKISGEQVYFISLFIEL
jgi:hypothetical protein